MPFNKQQQLLADAFRAERLPHALLFYGQKRIGKKDFALDFVSFVVKEKPGHPDFIFLDSEKEIQIREIRNIVEKLSFKPYSCSCKFALINNAHLMNREAQNCFLKFLEEPTDRTFLIMITEHPDLLLPTILSRVQKIRFYPQKGFRVERNEDVVSNFLKAVKSDMADRLNYAKSLSEGDVSAVLDSWMAYFRDELLSGDSSVRNKASYAIKEIERTKLLLSTTNINTRLALEILLMKM